MGAVQVATIIRASGPSLPLVANLTLPTVHAKTAGPGRLEVQAQALGLSPGCKVLQGAALKSSGLKTELFNSSEPKSVVVQLEKLRTALAQLTLNLQQPGENLRGFGMCGIKQRAWRRWLKGMLCASIETQTVQAVIT